MKVYSYSKCGTCRNAIKDLEAKKIKFEVIDITENPPSKNVLKSAVKAKGLQKLFNTSGVQYHELKIKDKLKSMTEAQAIELLASNGRFRAPKILDPFVVTCAQKFVPSFQPIRRGARYFGSVASNRSASVFRAWLFRSVPVRSLRHRR